MYCPECGTEVREDAKFCSTCGAAVPIAETPAEGERSIASRGRKRRRVVFGAAVVAVAAVVVLGALLMRPFGGDGEEAPENGAGMLETAVPSATAEPTQVAGGSEETAPGANMFRGNPAHTGEYPGPGPQGEPTLLWRFKTGNLYEGSTPAVVDGVLYVEGTDGYVYALNADNGDLLWNFEEGGTYASSPAVAYGLVFVNYLSSGQDDVYALDAKTGNVAWRFEMDGGGGTSAAVVEGVVYVAGGNYVYALDAETGEVRWRSDTGYIASNADPAVSEGAVYVGCGHQVCALEKDTGRALWRSKTEGHGATDGDVMSSPAVARGLIYVGGWTGYVYALDADSGEVRWRFRTTGDQQLPDPPPAVVNGVVYVGRADLYALDARTGGLLWQLEDGGRPAVADGVVYVTDSSNVCALRADSGETLWCLKTGRDLQTSPIVVDGIVYTVNDDGYVYAIGGSEG